ncbi:MAG: hypothetical protein KDK99_15010 [Verrucomicrobiales bacterium]|nr:hypothetical protein [Verrucomicrobiales bacterium]
MSPSIAPLRCTSPASASNTPLHPLLRSTALVIAVISLATHLVAMRSSRPHLPLPSTTAPANWTIAPAPPALQQAAFEPVPLPVFQPSPIGTITEVANPFLIDTRLPKAAPEVNPQAHLEHTLIALHFGL